MERICKKSGMQHDMQLRDIVTLALCSLHALVIGQRTDRLISEDRQLALTNRRPRIHCVCFISYRAASVFSFADLQLVCRLTGEVTSWTRCRSMHSDVSGCLGMRRRRWLCLCVPGRANMQTGVGTYQCTAARCRPASRRQCGRPGPCRRGFVVLSRLQAL